MGEVSDPGDGSIGIMVESGASGLPGERESESGAGTPGFKDRKSSSSPKTMPTPSGLAPGDGKKEGKTELAPSMTIQPSEQVQTSMAGDAPKLSPPEPKRKRGGMEEHGPALVILSLVLNALCGVWGSVLVSKEGPDTEWHGGLLWISLACCLTSLFIAVVLLIVMAISCRLPIWLVFHLEVLAAAFSLFALVLFSFSAQHSMFMVWPAIATAFSFLLWLLLIILQVIIAPLRHLPYDRDFTIKTIPKEVVVTVAEKTKPPTSIASTQPSEPSEERKEGATEKGGTDVLPDGEGKKEPPAVLPTRDRSKQVDVSVSSLAPLQSSKKDQPSVADDKKKAAASPPVPTPDATNQDVSCITAQEDHALPPAH